MEFDVLNFLSTMETIFNGVSRVKLSFYTMEIVIFSWGFIVLNFLSTMENVNLHLEFHVLNFLSTMETRPSSIDQFHTC